MAHDVLRALDKIHSQDKFHGTIKPDVILYQDERWKLMERFSTEKNFIYQIQKDIKMRDSLYASS